MSNPIIKVRNDQPSQLFTDISEILASVYQTRGITDKQQLRNEFDQLPSPNLLKSNMSAGKLLAEALIRQDKLLVVADFDVDGATSCSLMMLALKSMGARNVSYLVPDRFKYGYGLTPEIVDVAAGLKQGATAYFNKQISAEMIPDMVITVDNGIASIEGVARANQLGIKVLITDHHLPGKELPNALAIVNPNQGGCTFPSKALAGVGVAFYLVLALRMQLRQLGWFDKAAIDEPNLTQFLDLVALGTVADIVPLDHCNRVLVAQGMKRIRAGLCRPGITALLELGNNELSRVQPSDMGFTVGPRLNAAGRLDDMSLGIECLLAESHAKATELARELDHLNKERREIQSVMQEQALSSLAKLLSSNLTQDYAHFGLCLYEQDWHQGIIGLLASKVKDQIYRPVIVFADADCTENQEPLLKGSARSIPGLHIRDMLDTLATENPKLLNKFGGHAMAAGMTIRKSDLDAFKRVFYGIVENTMKNISIDNVTWSDGELPHKLITLDLARVIQQAGPWGQLFDEPAFHGDFIVSSQRTLSGKHLKVELENNQGRAFSGIAFFQEESLLSMQLHKVRLVYRVDVNFFRDQENLQLMIQTILPLEEDSAL